MVTQAGRAPAPSPRSPLSPAEVFAPGRTIAQYLADEPRPDHVECARILRELLDWIRPLHDRGEAYGNLAPWTVCLDRDDHVHLGLCEAPAMADDARMFLPPEFVEGDAQTPSTDLYAVGMIGHVIAVGRVPEPDAEDADDPTTYVPGLLGSLLRSLIDDDPLRRPTYTEARATLAAPVLNRLGIC